MLSKRKRGVDWQAASHRWIKSIQHMCDPTELKQARDKEEHPVEFKSYNKTVLLQILGTHCLELPAGKASAEVQMLEEVNRKPHDIVINTDGSVTRDRSSCGFMVKQDERTVRENYGAHGVTTMEVEAVTHAIQRLASQSDAQITHVIILTDSMNHLQKMSLEWASPTGTQLCSLRLQRLPWIYCPGHVRVNGNG